MGPDASTQINCGVYTIRPTACGAGIHLSRFGQIVETRSLGRLMRFGGICGVLFGELAAYLMYLTVARWWPDFDPLSTAVLAFLVLAMAGAVAVKLPWIETLFIVAGLLAIPLWGAGLLGALTEWDWIPEWASGPTRGIAAALAWGMLSISGWWRFFRAWGFLLNRGTEDVAQATVDCDEEVLRTGDSDRCHVDVPFTEIDRLLVIDEKTKGHEKSAWLYVLKHEGNVVPVLPIVSQAPDCQCALAWHLARVTGVPALRIPQGYLHESYIGGSRPTEEMLEIAKPIEEPSELLAPRVDATAAMMELGVEFAVIRSAIFWTGAAGAAAVGVILAWRAVVG